MYKAVTHMKTIYYLEKPCHCKLGQELTKGRVRTLKYGAQKPVSLDFGGLCSSHCFSTSFPIIDKPLSLTKERLYEDKSSAGILKNPLLSSDPLPQPHNSEAKNAPPGAGRYRVQFLLIKMSLYTVLTVIKSNCNPH